MLTDDWDGEDDTYEITCPVLFYKGQLFELRIDPESRQSRHAFGGSWGYRIRGMPRREPSLHLVLSVDLGDPLLGIEPPGMSEIPFLYGFRYDGCTLEYRVSDDGRVKITELSPRSALAGWPYAGYPSEFPRLSLRLTEPLEISSDHLEDLIWQSADLDYSESVIVIVPPSDDYGLSLWGEDGDAEEVQVVFELNPRTGVVSTFNQCG